MDSHHSTNQKNKLISSSSSSDKDILYVLLRLKAIFASLPFIKEGSHPSESHAAFKEYLYKEVSIIIAQVYSINRIDQSQQKKLKNLPVILEQALAVAQKEFDTEYLYKDLMQSLKEDLSRRCQTIIQATLADDKVDEVSVKRMTAIKENLLAYCHSYSHNVFNHHYTELNDLKKKLSHSSTFILEPIEHVITAIEKYILAKTDHQPWEKIKNYKKGFFHKTIPLLNETLNKMMDLLAGLNSINDIQRVRFMLQSKYLEKLCELENSFFSEGKGYLYYFKSAEVLNMLSEQIKKVDDCYYQLLQSSSEEKEKEEWIDFINIPRAQVKDNLDSLISLISKREPQTTYEKLNATLLKQKESMSETISQTVPMTPSGPHL